MTVSRAAMFAAGVAVGTFLGGRPALAVGGDAGQWTQHKDSRLGFTISTPAGWTVATSGQAIVVRSADKSAVALAEPFLAGPEEDVEDRLRKIVTNRAALFPKARVGDVTIHDTAAGDGVAASLAYQAPGGKPAQARLLCSIYARSGMLYGIGAASDRFAAQRPTLVKIVRSLRFIPPTKSAAPSTTGASAVSAAAAGVKFVRWTDPKEGSFHVDVPKGWNIQGGAFRAGAVDVRQVVQARAPQDAVTVLIGDPSLTTFAEPDPVGMSLGLREGSPYNPGGTQMVIYHFMPSLEFNRWYLKTRLSQIVSGIEVTKEQEAPELSRQYTAAANQGTGGMASVLVTVGHTEFKGTSKPLGKPIHGVLLSVTRRTVVPGSNTGLWFAVPMVCGYLGERRDLALAVFARMIRSWQVDPHWGTQQANTAGQVSKITAQTNAEISKTISDGYWQRSASGEETSRNWSNATLGLTDVTDPQTGETWKVSSGHNYYWRDARSGAVVGTDTADRPDIDLTPLTEF